MYACFELLSDWGWPIFQVCIEDSTQKNTWLELMPGKGEECPDLQLQTITIPLLNKVC